MAKKYKTLTFDKFRQITTMGSSNSSLSFPRYHNFPSYFMGGFIGEFKRALPHAKRFRDEHGDLDQRLCSGIQNRPRNMSTFEAIKPIEKDLYKAYRIMRSYGVSDKGLFI